MIESVFDETQRIIREIVRPVQSSTGFELGKIWFDGTSWTYTLSANDVGKIIIINTSTVVPVNITVTSILSSVKKGSIIQVVKGVNAGTIFFVSGDGLSVVDCQRGVNQLTQQWEIVELVKNTEGLNSWVAYGGL